MARRAAAPSEEAAALGQDLGLALLSRQNRDPRITEKFDALDCTEEFVIYVSKPCYITENWQI